MPGKGRPSSGRIVKSATLKIHPDAWEKFQVLAEKMGLTRSRLVEKIAAGEIPLHQNSEELINLTGKLLTS